MPKYKVEIIVSYPCVLEANSMEEAIEFAENTDWDDWPDDDSEIIEYEAELVDEEEEPIEIAPPKPAVKSTAKLTVIKGGQ
jgi:hypothetical protein